MIVDFDGAVAIYRQLTPTSARKLGRLHVLWILGDRDVPGILERKQRPGWSECPEAYAELQGILEHEGAIG